jgi:hypothetical protein
MKRQTKISQKRDVEQSGSQWSDYGNCDNSVIVT